jgi:NADP-dependent 3-hydroxy acid dehydrogenase YdfG
MTDFRGRLAVVTGASSGIGAAMGRALAERGATTCLVARWSRAADLAEAGNGGGALVRRYTADLGDEAAVDGLAARLLAECERIDVLVHSAGVFGRGSVAAAPVAELDQHYRLNVRAPYQLTQALLPRIVSCRGQIVFINSSVALGPARSQLSQYTASKHALKAIADGLRDEVNADGVRVLSVYPGRTASRMQESIHALEGRAYHPERLLQPEDVAEAVVSALTLPATAEVTDINIRPFVKAPA